jgi:hypothetical protein
MKFGEEHYSAVETEGLAVSWPSVQLSIPYSLERNFTIQTDYHSLERLDLLFGTKFYNPD